MFFKKKYKPWFNQTPMKKLSKSYASLQRCDVDKDPQLEHLKTRHEIAVKRFLTLKAIFLLRYPFAFMVNLAVFIVAFFYLLLPASNGLVLTQSQTDPILLLGFIYVPLGAVFLSSAFGLYMEGRLDEVEVVLDGVLQDVDAYTYKNHGFRAFPSEIY